MPWINTKDIPYKKKKDCGEHVIEHEGYCRTDSFYLEDQTVYRYYHTYDSFGYQMEHIIEFDDNGKVVRKYEELEERGDD